jgi:deoxyribodipyrimidine photolyase-related protein
MAEVAEESTHVWSSKPRTVMSPAGMRHFAPALRAADGSLHDARLDDPASGDSLQAQLHADIERLHPTGLVMTAPGDWRVLQAIKAVAQAHGLPLDIREDRHFFCSEREFAAHARGRKSLRMEYFYREMRKRHGVLMRGDQPEGSQWNFDEDNREPFGPAGPGAVPPRPVREPDAVTRADLPGVRRKLTNPGRRSSAQRKADYRHLAHVLGQAGSIRSR